MKRSTILTITLILIAFELVYSIAKLNEMYHFFDAVLQTKYYILFVIVYVLSVLWSLFYFMYVNLEVGDSERKKYFKKVFGDKSFNLIYSGHFFLFSGTAFYIDAWGYFGSALVMGLIWGWFRSCQNDYAYEYEIERKKEEARSKTTIVLND